MAKSTNGRRATKLRPRNSKAKDQTQTFDKGAPSMGQIPDMPEVDARKVDIVRIECERIRRNDPAGVLHPEAIVDAARPVHSLMHPMFEWDNEVAGEKHRVTQARQIIRVFIVRSNSDDTDDAGALLRTVQRIYLSPPDQRSTGGGYLTFEQVSNSKERRKAMARQAVADIRRFANSPQYAGFDELSGLLREVATVADKWWWKLELN